MCKSSFHVNYRQVTKIVIKKKEEKYALKTFDINFLLVQNGFITYSAMFACKYYEQQCKCTNIWFLAVIMLKNSSDNYLPYRRESADSTGDRSPPSVCNFRTWDANASVGIVEHVWRVMRTRSLKNRNEIFAHGNLNATTDYVMSYLSHQKKNYFFNSFLPQNTKIGSIIFLWLCIKNSGEETFGFTVMYDDKSAARRGIMIDIPDRQ